MRAQLAMAGLAVLLYGAAGCTQGPKYYPVSGTVTLDGKQLEHGDIFFVDISGQLHTLEKQRLAQIRKEEKPLMPVDAAKLLSAAEIENLVAYLKTLNARDMSQNMGGLISASGAVVIDIRPDLISTGGFSSATTG